jgi:hypothetical protein
MQIVKDKILLNENSFIKKAEEHIKKDLKTHQLDKKIIKKLKDAQGDEVLICTINGDYVRDKQPGLDFDEFTDGGHYYVDYKLPKAEQKYAKHIPENEIWIDDLFELKLNDMRAILQHEFVERNLMKYKGYTYEKAHLIANKKEVEYRQRVKI